MVHINGKDIPFVSKSLVRGIKFMYLKSMADLIWLSALDKSQKNHHEECNSNQCSGVIYITNSWWIFSKPTHKNKKFMKHFLTGLAERVCSAVLDEAEKEMHEWLNTQNISAFMHKGHSPNK